MVYKLSERNQINKGSSLRRNWVVLNDPDCPALLSNAGLTTQWELGGEFALQPTGSISTSSPVYALQVRFVLFDVFGEQIRTISTVEVTDLPSKAAYDMKNLDGFVSTIQEFRMLLTIAVCVSQVRGVDGKVWKCNETSIAKELARIQSNLKGSPGPANGKK